MIIAQTLNDLDKTVSSSEGHFWIKIILIILLLVVLRAFLVQKSLVLAKRLTAVGLFLLLVFLVLFPEYSTKIANMVGVGRGVDLLFYLSNLFLLLLIVALWRRVNMLSETVTKLARELAIEKARKPEEPKD
jgi:hypothetical protein